MKKLLQALLLTVAPIGVTVADVPYQDGSTISCSSATSTQFVPSWGQVLVGADEYTRYTKQWMYWHDASRLAWFIANGDSTFEPDAFFDGSGSGSPEPDHPTDVWPDTAGNSTTAYGYFMRNVSYNHGDFGYWASDLPTPYQDTAWSSGGNEWEVTVGSASAVELNAGTLYYTVTRMPSGGAVSGEVKLQAQRGRRANPTTPWYVDYWGKWNAYQCGSQPNNIQTIPWYSFTAPGCHRYWHQWDISTTSSCN